MKRDAFHLVGMALATLMFTSAWVAHRVDQEFWDIGVDWREGGCLIRNDSHLDFWVVALQIGREQDEATFRPADPIRVKAGESFDLPASDLWRQASEWLAKRSPSPRRTASGDLVLRRGDQHHILPLPLSQMRIGNTTP